MHENLYCNILIMIFRKIFDKIKAAVLFANYRTWLAMLFYELIYLKSFFKNKKNYENSLIICCAGIGDTILAQHLIKSLAKKSNSGKVDLLIKRNSHEVVRSCDFVKQIYIFEDDELCGFVFKNEYTLIVSVRTPIVILKSLYLNGRAPILLNPLYERARIFSRICSKVNNSFRKKYYSRLHMADILANMIGVKPSGIKIALKFSDDNSSKLPFLHLPSRYVLVNVGGRDEIRHLKVSFILDILKSFNVPLVLVGDNENYMTDACNSVPTIINLVGKTKISDLYFLIKNAQLVIAPDSMIMHLTAATNTNLIALMGNAMVETYGPYNCTSQVKVLTRLPPCSPCSRTTCSKYGGYSCVQDIAGNEVVDAVRVLMPELLK